MVEDPYMDQTDIYHELMVHVSKTTLSPTTPKPSYNTFFFFFFFLFGWFLCCSFIGYGKSAFLFLLLFVIHVFFWFVCLCWGVTAQSTQCGHVECGQFT